MNNNINDISFEGVEIILKGKKFILDYSMAGMKYLAKKYGSVTKALNKINDLSNDINENEIDFICDLIYAGLVHENKNLIIEDVESLVSFRNLEYCMKKITDSIFSSLPQSNESNESIQQTGE